MIIVLLGYMTSGKTIVANELSKKMNLPYIDLDTYLEDKEGKSISAIFAEGGEVSFRYKEHQYLKEVLINKDNCILSLGGGTPCYANNMQQIITNEKCISIYLKATVATLVERIQKAKEQRPVVRDINAEELPEFVSKHLFERSYFYEKATKKIIVNDKTPIQIAEEIENVISLNKQ